jgi:hypothetical protein
MLMVGETVQTDLRAFYPPEVSFGDLTPCNALSMLLAVAKGRSAMPNAQQQQERNFRRRRQLERRILEALRDNGPALWEGLYVAFGSPGNGEVGDGLHGLRTGGYIEQSQSGMTYITDKGVKLLEDAEYWS